jgi:hypothetical protein
MDPRLSQQGLRYRQAQLLMKAIQMTQRSGILQHPLRFTPGFTLELLTRLVELGLRSLSTIEMTESIKPPERLFDLLHCLLDLHRFIKKPLGFSPGATRMARHPSRVLPASLGLLQLRSRFERRLDLTLDSVP